ncbi:MAG TPA: DUF4340 domain-containing protein [Methylomirabilota bacterium]|jgi:hypothetical protein|nr:DUF4340 domain-containing protein [Methylomirabilota bacterium]
MRWQTTAALALLLAVLGGFYYLYEVRWGPGREEAAARKGRVFVADTKDVTAVALRRGAESVQLSRDGEAWQMLEPVKARASRPAVDELLANVLTAKIDREIDANPKSPADFGLDKPAADLTLTLKDGKSLGLELGAKNPTGVWVYARERGKPAVFVLGESVLRDATKPVADFRDRTILAFESKDVSGFELVLPEETIDVEGAPNAWRITKPVALRADNETVSEFLDKLTAQKVKEFVAEAPATRDAYGLERPIRITINTGKDTDRSSRTLLLGKVDDARKGVYAMRGGESSVLLLPEEVYKQVPKNVGVLRSKTLVEIERDKVAKLEIEGPKGAVTVARDGGQWKIVAPQALPADQVEVGAILTKLADLRAQGFLSEDASGIARYLAKPEVKVALTDQAGTTTTVLLASSKETRGGAASAYAAVAGKGPVTLVDAKALTDLGRSATDLRDRRIVAGLEPRDVKRVRIKAGGQTMVVERSGETEWRVVEPAKGAANTQKVDDLLYALRGLRFKDVAAPEGQEPARYGLDAPSLEVTMFKGDGGEIATVQVGKREGDLAYVRTTAQPAVYSVESRTLGPAPKVPDDFKG